METASTMKGDGFFVGGGVAISVSGLTKLYTTSAEEVRALKGIQWEVASGEAVALMGPSGCGKTTLLNLLGGVDRPTEGQIVVGDQEVTGMNERVLERYRLIRVGFVFQFFNLIPTLTALENVQFPMLIAGPISAIHQERAKELLGMVGLGEKLHKRPDELSGGEQQRVTVAVALANDPSLILADEPTGNLDSANTQAIASLFASLAQRYGKTVVMASHDPRAVEQFARVCHMSDGRFV